MAKKGNTGSKSKSTGSKPKTIKTSVKETAKKPKPTKAEDLPFAELLRRVSTVKLPKK